MKQLAVTILAILGLTLPEARAETGGSVPDFREVYEVISTNLAGLTVAELNQAAVDGLLAQLRGRASIVGTGEATNPALARFIVVERSIAVARAGQFSAKLAEELLTNFRAASVTNKLKGLVLDLRFVAGDDYAAIIPATELFVAKDRDLLDWGNGMIKSGSEAAAIEAPLAVLMNRETLGAPEALAGALRETGVALLLGNATAGRALAGREFTLASGHKIRVATTPVKLGDGSEIPPTGLKPDINVNVSLESERAFINEPFSAGATTGASTNGISLRPARSRRPSEADLVRERRESTNRLVSPSTRESQPEKPTIVDPVLARAVDLLKGLAVVRGSRS